MHAIHRIMHMEGLLQPLALIITNDRIIFHKIKKKKIMHIYAMCIDIQYHDHVDSHVGVLQNPKLIYIKACVGRSDADDVFLGGRREQQHVYLVSEGCNFERCAYIGWHEGHLRGLHSSFTLCTMHLIVEHWSLPNRSFFPFLCAQGRYDILSISGSFFQNQVSVSLAGPDGRIIGGKVEGVFVAATPIKASILTRQPPGFTWHQSESFK